MKKNNLLFLIAGLFFLLPSVKTQAQDTTWVQTFTFDSLYTRRAKFYFPTANEEYRKILMFFNIKCYNGVSGDGNYPCGEWDYIYFNSVYDHRGQLDSTAKTGRYFTVEGMGNVDTLKYNPAPQYDINRYYLYNTVIDNISSANNYTVGTATTPMPHPFNFAAGNERSQFIWKASELSAAGLTAGSITGIKLNFQGNSAVINNLRIRMKLVTADTFGVNAMIDDTLSSAYHYNRVITTSGWNNFQFNQPFTWNGTSNILIDFSYENNGTGTANLLLGSNTAQASGLYSTTANYSISSFNNQGGNVQFDKSLNMFSGNSDRTYEMWVKVDSFQSGWGAVFSAGNLGSNNKDFSFITTSPNNNYKFNFWGSNDFTFSGPNMKQVWKHLAVSFGNDTVRIYLNGNLIQQRKKTGINTPTDRDFFLGQWGNNGGNLLGKFSHLRIWDKVITQNELKDWIGKDVTPSHPQYSHLKADYRLNSGNGLSIPDMSPNSQMDGNIHGNMWWRPVAPRDYYYNGQKLNWRPQIQFEKNVYTSHVDSVLVNDTVFNQPSIVNFFDNPAGNYVINDNDPANPGLRTGTRYVWSHKYAYIRQNGVIVDSIANTLDSAFYNQNKAWYSNTVVYEIGRSISPYGKNLILGEGRTRIHDLTDYYSILQDTVDLEVGGTQEVQDVRFAFIKGEPPAEVNRILQPWGKGWSQHKYSNIASDAALPPMTLNLLPNTDQVKFRSYITGHGGAENNGPSFPNGCCEFMYNDHFYKSGGQPVHQFRIQRSDCGLNAIYPQGGTWVYDREGWCPGDIIVGHDYNVTPHMAGGQINLDYNISPIPNGGGNVGNGVYDVGLQVIEYKTPGRNNDAEIYDILKPSDAFVLSRVNPICHTPQVVIRNDGKNPLTAAVIKYKVSGGTEETFNWTGNLKFLDTAKVDLPVSSLSFWNGDASNKFMVRIAGVNGGADEYAGNDSSVAAFNMPDIFPMNKIVVKFKTNARPNENTLTLKDFDGNVILQKSGLTANTQYNDTLILTKGCFTFVLEDAGNNGLTWWAAPDQGSGNISILHGVTGANLKSFNSDFGKQIFYTFTVDNTTDIGDLDLDKNVAVFPNPNSGNFTLQIQGVSGQVDLELTNVLGQSLWKDKISSYGSTVRKNIETKLPAGVYLLNMTNGKAKSVKKVVIQ
jgi:hypothetical protein